MTAKDYMAKKEKDVQALEEICENTRSIRRVVNKIFDHLQEYQEKREDYDPDSISWQDLYDNNDMYSQAA
jgi:hypothetical protein